MLIFWNGVPTSPPFWRYCALQAACFLREVFLKYRLSATSHQYSGDATLRIINYLTKTPLFNCRAAKIGLGCEERCFPTKLTPLVSAEFPSRKMFDGFRLSAVTAGETYFASEGDFVNKLFRFVSIGTPLRVPVWYT